MVRRALPLLASAILLLGGGAASARPAAALCGAGCAAAPAGSGPLFVLTGHGWGHGVGMSQYGAFGYAQHGWTYQQIVAHYYPGTTIAPTQVTELRVLLAEKKKSLKIVSAVDFTVTDGAGTAHQLPAGAYSFGPGLKLKIGDAPAAPLPAPLTFAPGAAPLQLTRPYRGSIMVDVVDGKLRAVNIVGLEQYLYGVVPAEMPSSWSTQALEAQAVAARSYALATRNVAAPFDLYSDTRSQVYLGVAHEQASTNAAVDATAGQVVVYGGKVARTLFFSTSGGRTANGSDVFGGGQPVPYLVSVPDPYDVISPYHDWGPVAFTGSQLAKAFGVKGGVKDASTVPDSTGRVQTLALQSATGEVDVLGTAARSKLRLRSTWFGVGVLALVPPVSGTPPLEIGGTAQLTGIDRGVAGVVVEQRPAGGTWQQLAPVTPGANGSVALTVTPAVTTQYRLATATVAAAPVRIPVAPSVRLTAPSGSSALAGTVKSAPAGTQVDIQTEDETTGAWTTVASGTVAADGSFSVPVTLTAGVYRARVAPAAGLVAGTSPPLRVLPG